MEQVNNVSVSYIIALTGNLSELEKHAIDLLRAASQWSASHPEHEIVVVADGPLWAHITRDCAPPLQVIKTEEACNLPAKLFNMGAEVTTRSWIAFGLPGVEVKSYESNWLTNVHLLLKDIPDSSECVGLIGNPGHCEVQENTLFSHRLQCATPGIPDIRYPYSVMAAGWLEMFDLIPIHNCVISRQYFIANGGFMTLPIMQRAFWWELCLRLARRGDFHWMDIPATHSKWCLEDYPLLEIPGSNTSIDTFARIVSRYNFNNSESAAAAQLVPDFPELEPVLKDFIVSKDNGALPSFREAFKVAHWPVRPLRITILGGPNEPLHTEIFFLNYFRLLEGKGLVTWRVIDDIYVTHADIDQSDMVIFCRVRSEEGCHALDYAKRIDKPCLYMLDDNWFTIGSDWPEAYGHFIYPGSPFYENALYCIRNADAVYTSSPVMAEYLECFAKYLFMFPMNINLSAYSVLDEDKKTNREEFLVGYAGTPRYNTAAFNALVELARRRKLVKIFYLGYEGPQVFHGLLPPDKVIYVPGTHSYSRYAQRLAKLSPDIGIAPLGTTEVERAKNPSKYLDYAAARCVGVYSNVEPYASFVTHGKTGWLVPGNSLEEWVNAIEVLLDDSELLAFMRETSYLDVKENYSTEKILPRFLQMLSRIYYRNLS